MAVLALLALLSLIGGCRRAASPVRLRHSVRMAALYPLHPAWAQVTALDAQAAEAAPSTVSPVGALSALPTPFTPPTGLPPNITQEQERLVKEDARRYIAQLQSALDLRSQELIRAKERAERRLADSEYRAAVTAKAKELRDANLALAKVAQHDLNQLNYRDAALESQIRVYSDSGLNARTLINDARLQQKELQRRVEVKTEEITGLLHADFEGLAVLAEQGYHQSLEETAQKNVQQFTLEQHSRDQQEIAQAQARLDALPTAIPALAEHVQALDTRATPLQLPPPPPWQADDVAAQTALAAAAQRRREMLAAQRARLVAVIADDTQKTVAQIAWQQGWTLAPPGSADDWTEQIKPALRDRWHTEKEH